MHGLECYVDFHKLTVWGVAQYDIRRRWHDRRTPFGVMQEKVPLVPKSTSQQSLSCWPSLPCLFFDVKKLLATFYNEKSEAMDLCLERGLIVVIVGPLLGRYIFLRRKRLHGGVPPREH